MSIDYDSLRERLWQKKLITKKQKAEMEEDEDYLPNEISAGDSILSVAWDGEAPGCSGAMWVTRWKGFYFLHSSDFDTEGPFDSLQNVLDSDWFNSGISSPEISSSSLQESEVLAIARLLVSEGDTIKVNGDHYVLRVGSLMKLDPAS